MGALGVQGVVNGFHACPTQADCRNTCMDTITHATCAAYTTGDHAGCYSLHTRAMLACNGNGITQHVPYCCIATCSDPECFVLQCRAGAMDVMPTWTLDQIAGLAFGVSTYSVRCCPWLLMHSLLATVQAVGWLCPPCGSSGRVP